MPFFSSIEDPAVYLILNFQVIFSVSLYAKVRPENILYIMTSLNFKDKPAEDWTMDMEYQVWMKAQSIFDIDYLPFLLSLSLYEI